MPDIFIASKKKRFASNLLTSFINDPDDLGRLKYYDQHKHEKLILVLRAHWVTNLGWLALSFILLIFPFFALPFIKTSDFINFNFPFGVILSAVIFWYLVTFGYILMNFLFWFYNLGIVTNERVIDVDFTHLLYSEVTETVIPKIEDITDKRGGFLSIFFDYGNVFVQTAGTNANIEFINIPKPGRVVPIISKLVHD